MRRREPRQMNLAPNEDLSWYRVRTALRQAIPLHRHARRVPTALLLLALYSRFSVLLPLNASTPTTSKGVGDRCTSRGIWSTSCHWWCWVPNSISVGNSPTVWATIGSPESPYLTSTHATPPSHKSSKRWRRCATATTSPRTDGAHRTQPLRVRPHPL